jgi:hypothetical protein
MLHQVDSKKLKHLQIVVRRIMVETGRQHLVSGMQPHKRRRLIKDSALAIGSLSSIILGYSRLVHLSQCTHSPFPVLSLFSIAFTKGAIELVPASV